MSHTVARRYARALYEEAAHKECVASIDEDVAMIQASLDASPELARFFADPVISADKKRSVIQKLFASRVHAVMLSFLNLLVEKRRENVFPEVATSYRSLRDEQLNIVRAEARVALPLNDAEHKQLGDALEALTGRTVMLTTRVDPSLIGGVIVRVGDTVYDRSVQNQLTQLKGQLEQRAMFSN